MTISTFHYRLFTLILLAAVGTRLTGCTEQETSAPTAKWQQVKVRKYSAEELGEKKLKLHDAIIDSIGPLRAQRKQMDSELRHSDYELLDIEYYGGKVGGSLFLVAVGKFMERGVARVGELDAQVTSVMWQDRILATKIAEGFLGLGKDNPIRLWWRSGDNVVRLLEISHSSPYHYTTSTAIDVFDYNLGTGKCTNVVSIGSSEHDSRNPVVLNVEVDKGMIITVTHPDDGKDDWADVEAGSDCENVRIEQLSKASVRVHL